MFMNLNSKSADTQAGSSPNILSSLFKKDTTHKAS